MKTKSRPESFTEYLRRVAQDYDDSANVDYHGEEKGLKPGDARYEESPTAKDYRDAAKRITLLELALVEMIPEARRLNKAARVTVFNPAALEIALAALGASPEAMASVDMSELEQLAAAKNFVLKHA